MSPKKSLHDDDNDHNKQHITKTGRPPKPLKLNQESHTIHKQQPGIRKPIIIYTRSPEVIHTKPHDFMALVQKLTGHSGSKDQEEEQQKKTLQAEYDLNEKGGYSDSGVIHDQNDNLLKSKSLDVL